MPFDSMKIAREINLRIPAMMTSALEHSRSMSGSEAARQAEADFRATFADLPEAVPADGIAFAVARYAAQIIDQVSVEAAMDAEQVIRHFAVTYLETAEEEN